MNRREPARRLRLVLAGGLLSFALIGLWYRTPLWRAAYPHLPRRLQALPYRWQAWWPGRPTPVSLPTLAIASTASPAAPFARSTRDAPPPAPQASVTPGVTATPATTPPARADITGVRHEYQTWNNCGPATISMALSVFGAGGDQASAAAVLKPDPDDKNVGPDELAAYARRQGYGALVRVNGSTDRLKRLLAAGFPLIVETWFVPEPGDEMGHYRVLTGYDEADGAFRAADSYHGPRVRLPFGDFDRLWRVFNRTYVVVYPRHRDSEAMALLGADRDDRAMYVAAAARAQAEVGTEADAFGWFNLGSSLVGLGEAPAAAGAYDRARRLGLPWRMLWYQFGPLEAYAAVGRWDDVRALAVANLANAPNLEESHYWLGRARAAAGDAAGSRSSWERALALNPHMAAARSALDALGR